MSFVLSNRFERLGEILDDFFETKDAFCFAFCFVQRLRLALQPSSVLSRRKSDRPFNGMPVRPVRPMRPMRPVRPVRPDALDVLPVVKLQARFSRAAVDST